VTVLFRVCFYLWYYLNESDTIRLTFKYDRVCEIMDKNELVKSMIDVRYEPFVNK
jgi:hypothetical protein